MKQKLSESITHQNCSNVLKEYGVSCPDVGNINAPYRTDSNQKLYVNNNLWCDHGTGESGHVRDLAKKLTDGDVKESLALLCKAAGVPENSIAGQDYTRLSDNKEMAFSAMEKVKSEFSIDNAPQEIKDYLTGRKISSKGYAYLSYIPDMNSLSSILDADEISTTGLSVTVGKIILWFMKDDKPTYYAYKGVHEKGYRFAKLKNGILERRLWNEDALYSSDHVVLAEGLFDGLSLVEMGYGVCSDLTCNVGKDRVSNLVTALRWRQRQHPDWKFTIYFDDDVPNDETGRVAGNDGAEKLAMQLFEQGINFTWVKHDSSRNTAKLDINDMHKNGLEREIHGKINEAKKFTELLEYDETLFINAGMKLLYTDPFHSKDILSVVEKNSGKALSEMLKSNTKARISWRKMYDSRIDHIWQNNEGIYVQFAKGEHPESDDIITYPTGRLIPALRKYQITKGEIRFDTLDIDEKTTVYDVSLETSPHPNQHNIYRAPSILTTPIDDDTTYEIPSMWNMVLDNLADAEEKEYFVNHLSTFVNTLSKPQTIPVLAGGFGTGKTVFMKLFATIGLGGFHAVTNDDLLSNFDDWMIRTPCLFIDELERPDKFQQARVDAKLRYLVNEEREIRRKNKENHRWNIKPYIVMAFNLIGDVSPLKIVPGDRRYSVIGGGKNINLVNCKEWDYLEFKYQTEDFIRYLRAYSYDNNKANIVCESKARTRLIGMSHSVDAQRIVSILESDSIKHEVSDCGLVPLKVITDIFNLNNKRYPKVGAKRIKNIMMRDMGLKAENFWKKESNKTLFNYNLFVT